MSFAIPLNSTQRASAEAFSGGFTEATWAQPQTNSTIPIAATFIAIPCATDGSIVQFGAGVSATRRPEI